MGLGPCATGVSLAKGKENIGIRQVRYRGGVLSEENMFGPTRSLNWSESALRTSITALDSKEGKRKMVHDIRYTDSIEKQNAWV